MASTLWSFCACGRMYLVFIPRARIGEALERSAGEIAELREIDEREEQGDEVEVAQKVAELTGATFFDSRKTAAVTCPCGQAMDAEELLAILRREARLGQTEESSASGGAEMPR